MSMMTKGQVPISEKRQAVKAIKQATKSNVKIRWDKALRFTYYNRVVIEGGFRYSDDNFERFHSFSFVIQGKKTDLTMYIK